MTEATRPLMTANNLMGSQIPRSLEFLVYLLPAFFLLGSGGLAAGIVADIMLLLWPPAWASYWVCLIPALYSLWFIFTLGILATIRTLLKGVLYRKPGEYESNNMPVRLSLVQRLNAITRLTIETLPLYRVFFYFSPFLRGLILRAICGVDNFHRGARISTVAIYDPDHVYLEDGAFGGGVDTKYVAHLLLPKDGRLMFTLAPIRVGKNAFIGGGCVLGGGVTVGEGAVLQIGSVVAPFTEIPAGEVWGGAPARPKNISALDGLTGQGGRGR